MIRQLLLAACAAASFAAAAWCQLPDGPGRTETQAICTQCHELARSIAPRQDKAGWQATVDKMISLGAKGTDKDFQMVVDYLAKSYPGEEVPRIKINEARAIDLESGLSLLRSQARAVIEYRDKNGPFKSIEDLKKVPGIDIAKIEAKKDRLIF